MSIEFRILGPVEAWENRRRVDIRRPKELLLLSVLLLHPNEVMPVDRLLDELWPVDAPDKPAQALQELVYQLRKKLESDRPRGSVVERVGDGYRINVSADALDLSRFERLVGEAERAKREGDLQLASLSLAEALAIWRGGPLSSLVLDPLTAAGAEVRRLEEL